MITWIELNKDHLAHNIEQFKTIAPQSEIWPVVKSNAYGHGVEQIAELLDQNDNVAGLMVVNLAEAIVLSKITSKLLLVLSYFDRAEEQLKIASERKIILPIYDLATAEYLNNLGYKFLINIKIDTGTSRLGLRGEEAVEAIKKIEGLKNLEIISLFTHFAESESADQTFTKKQVIDFQNICQQFPQYKTHAACSAATFSQPQAQGDIIRLGVSLYGLWPSTETKERGQEKEVELKPVLSWKTKIIQVKNIKAGETVGYNRTWQAKKDTKLAILPIGYNEGYNRLLSNKGQVIIKGKRYSVRGNICMNLTMVELIPDVKIEVGEEVVLLGAGITAEEIANLTQTINYEVVTRINSNLPRIIV
jgi:alanine racemase